MPRLRYQLREARSQLRHQRRRMPLMRQGEGRKALVDVRRSWRTRGVRSGSDARRMSRGHVPHSGPLRPELSPRSRSKPELLLVVRKCQGVGPRYSWLQPGCSSEARVSEPERLHGLVDLRVDRRTQTFSMRVRTLTPSCAATALACRNNGSEISTVILTSPR